MYISIINIIRYIETLYSMGFCICEGISILLSDALCFICAGQLDLVFIIDGSGSVCNDVPGWDKASGENCAPWNMVISFMESIIEDFNINDDYVRVAAIVFGNSARVHWDLNR